MRQASEPAGQFQDNRDAAEEDQRAGEEEEMSFIGYLANSKPARVGGVILSGLGFAFGIPIMCDSLVSKVCAQEYYHAQDKQKEIDLQILRKVEYVSDQKSLADELGFSVGKVNYILKALIKKGLIKAERFAKSENKKGYRYLLTKKGFQEKIEL